MEGFHGNCWLSSVAVTSKDVHNEGITPSNDRSVLLGMGG